MRSARQGAVRTLNGAIQFRVCAARRGEVVSTELPTATRHLLPACSSLAWAYVRGDEATTPLLLVVFRQLTANERHEHRAA